MWNTWVNKTLTPYYHFFPQHSYRKLGQHSSRDRTGTNAAGCSGELASSQVLQRVHRAHLPHFHQLPGWLFELKWYFIFLQFNFPSDTQHPFPEFLNRRSRCVNEFFEVLGTAVNHGDYPSSYWNQSDWLKGLQEVKEKVESTNRHSASSEGSRILPRVKAEPGAPTWICSTLGEVGFFPNHQFTKRGTGLAPEV